MTTLFALCLHVLVAMPQVPSLPPARETVDGTIAEAIRVLEAKDYESFLSTFPPPDLVKSRAASPEALKEWSAQFGPRAESLLAALRSVRGKTPEFDEARTTATFSLETQGLPNRLRLVKVGRRWYLSDR